MGTHPRILSLCTGIGGLDLGLNLAIGARTVCAVEIDKYCQQVLIARQQDGSLEPFPIWDDLKTFDADEWRGAVDIITAGYPCQPFSVSGQRKGADDPRHLWPAIARHIGAVRPALVFLENVPGHLSLGFPDVAADLSELGYEVAAGIFSAAEVGGSHLRERLFILAYRIGDGGERWGGHGELARAASVLEGDAAERQWGWCAADSGSSGDGAADVEHTAGIGRQEHADARRVECAQGQPRRPQRWPATDGASPGLYPPPADVGEWRDFLSRTGRVDFLPALPTATPHPIFVNWLIGFPHGWDTPDSLEQSDYEHWETLSFLRLQLLVSLHSLGNLG